MYPQELNLVEETFAYLGQAVARPLDPPAKKLTSGHIEAIIQLLERWPQSQLFPRASPSDLCEGRRADCRYPLPVPYPLYTPVMDLSRLVVAFCPTAYAEPALRARFFTALFAGASWAEPWTSPLAKPRETNLLFLFRAVANAFQDGLALGDGAWMAEVSFFDGCGLWFVGFSDGVAGIYFPDTGEDRGCAVYDPLKQPASVDRDYHVQVSVTRTT